MYLSQINEEQQNWTHAEKFSPEQYEVEENDCLSKNKPLFKHEKLLE